MKLDDMLMDDFGGDTASDPTAPPKNWWGEGLPPNFFNPGSPAGKPKADSYGNPWDQSAFDETGFYTDSPGPGYDAYGRKMNTSSPETPQPKVTGNDFTPINMSGGGGSGGGGGPLPVPAVAKDSSQQPVQGNYDALNNLLMQMFQSQQARDTESANYRGSIRGSILDRIKQVSSPKDMNSPEIAAQSKAYRTSSERNLRSQREALAERSHAQGLPSGATDAGVAAAYTGARRDQGAYDANLLGSSLKQQRDELDQLLSLGAGVLSADDMQAVQSHRDQLDAQLRQISTKQAGNLGQGDLDLRKLLGLGSLNLQGQSVNNQNDQFNTRYGLDFGNSEWEHNYLDTILGLR